MRQRIFMLVVLLMSQPVVAQDAVQVGRYLTVAPIPTAEQLEPLSVIVNVRFPRSVHTVGGALQHLLPPSGYQLADTRHADPQLAVLMTRPLPEVHRQIGPMPLQKALTTLAGDGWQLEVDPVYRLVSFRLQGALRERYAQVVPPVWTPEPPIREDARPTAGWFEAPVADTVVSGDRYGPVRPDETLLGIALHLIETRYWSERSLARRGLVALLRANPGAFLTIDGTPNLNLLRTGVYLRIPAEHEVRAIPRDEAERTIAQQHEDWQRYLTARERRQEVGGVNHGEERARTQSLRETDQARQEVIRAAEEETRRREAPARELEEQRRREQMEQEQRRLAASRGERESADRRAREGAQRQAYLAEVQATVERRWRVPAGSSASDEALVLVQINPDTGRILSYDLQRCSGGEAFCESVRQTMDRLQSLPRPPDAASVQGGIRIRLSPDRDGLGDEQEHGDE